MFNLGKQLVPTTKRSRVLQASRSRSSQSASIRFRLAAGKGSVEDAFDDPAGPLVTRNLSLAYRSGVLASRRMKTPGLVKAAWNSWVRYRIHQSVSQSHYPWRGMPCRKKNQANTTTIPDTRRATSTSTVIATRAARRGNDAGFPREIPEAISQGPLQRALCCRWIRLALTDIGALRTARSPPGLR